MRLEVGRDTVLTPVVNHPLSPSYIRKGNTRPNGAYQGISRFVYFRP
jgi:hypothetical protein